MLTGRGSREGGGVRGGAREGGREEREGMKGEGDREGEGEREGPVGVLGRGWKGLVGRICLPARRDHAHCRDVTASHLSLADTINLSGFSSRSCLC